MANTFFKTLVFLEEDWLRKSDKKSSKSSSSLLSRLIKFVESGSVVDSDIEKFILKNFRLSSADITDKWNEINYDRVKSKDTIRGQVSVLNRYFCSLFDITADGLSEAFVVENTDVLTRLSDILVAFDIGDFNIAERFPVFQKYLPDDSTDSVYTVEECTKEIHFLKTLDKSVIENMLTEINQDKLIYVLQSIRQPLLTNYYKKSEDKNSKQKLCSVNHEKVAFYKAFSVIKPKQLKPVDNIEVPVQNGSGVVELDETVSEQDLGHTIEMSEPAERFSTQFNLSLPRGFETILTGGLERYKTLPVKQKLELSGKSTNESKQRCKNFFRQFTEEGFKEHLNSLNIYDVVCELEKLKKGEKKEDEC